MNMIFNPGMLGLTPQQMQAAHEIGKHVRIEIRKCPREGKLEIRYLAIDPGDTKAEQLAHMHDTMFGMKGEIIHVS